MRSTLGSRRLRRILAAYTVNRLGTWFGLLALIVVVYDHTHSALAISALLFAGQALPAFAVPVVVARVEASRRRHELTALFAFEAIATAALAVLATNFSLIPTLALVFLDGTAALAASALVRSELARAAREEIPDTGPGALDGDAEAARHQAERNANAALNVAFSSTFVIGPVLGGAMVAAAGAPAALYVDVASFVLCGLLLLDLHPHVEEAGGETVTARLAAAWRHINEAPSLRGLLIAEAIALVFIETGAPIEVPLVKSTLGAGDRGLGLLLTMWGAGAVAGSLVFARLARRPLRDMIVTGTLLIGVAYLGLAVTPGLALACAAGLLGGVGNALQWPALISLVQQLTPGHLQGRMMGAVESLGAVSVAVGLTLGGVLVALSSPRVAFVIVGLGSFAATVALLRLAPSGTPLATGGEGPPDGPAPERFPGSATGEAGTPVLGEPGWPSPVPPPP